MTNVTRSRRQVRLSRALGLALTPKAVKHFEKRPYPPGEHGRDRMRQGSEYLGQLREKQKARRIYGLLEKLSAVLVRRPKRAEVPVTCEVQLVVEYYAR